MQAQQEAHKAKLASVVQVCNLPMRWKYVLPQRGRRVDAGGRTGVRDSEDSSTELVAEFARIQDDHAVTA